MKSISIHVSSNNLENTFAAAVQTARATYRGIRTGRFSGGATFLRIHLTTDGRIEESSATNRGTTSFEEYYRQVPHDLTLWEIEVAQIGMEELADEYGGEERLGAICRSSGNEAFADLPADPDKWTSEQRTQVFEVFVDDSMPFEEEIMEKRALFEAWAVDNLRCQRSKHARTRYR